jgi:CRISPR-associated protein Cas1
MTTVYVREQGSTVRRRGERIVVTKQQHDLMDLPLIHLEQLALVGSVQLTAQAAATLLQNNVDVVYYSSRFKYLGRLVTNDSKFAQLRHAQLQAMNDEAATLRLARQMVLGKISNGRVVLQRRLRDAVDPPTRSALAGAVAGMARMMDGAARADDPDRLRGYEGQAAVHYFSGLRALLDPAWGFTVRAYHPAPDPMNALLSFGYALLQKDTVSAVQLVGLDPYLGYFHTIDYGRPSMALDLMEEFRPILVDTLVLGLISRNQITPSDFVRTGRTERPLELAPAGLDLVLRSYEDRMAQRIKHPVAAQRVTYRRCLELQARQVAHVVLGRADTYVPVVIQ